MQGNEAVGAISNVLLKTLSPDRAQRQQAEEEVQRLYNEPGAAMLLFKIIELHAAGPTEPDVSIRQAAANLVKKRWEVGGDDEGAESAKERPLSQEEKDAVKGSILDLMCSVPSDVQKQLSEALTIISEHDFPEKWQNLLGDMVGKFASRDLHIINGVLRSANAILKRFRYAFKSDDLYRQLLFCLNNFAAPLTELFTWACQVLEEAAKADDQGKLTNVMETVRLCCRVFFSFNWQDIPEFFEDNMDRWFPPFATLLAFSHRLLVDDSEEERPGPLELVRAAVVENVNLYATKYEEEFQRFLPTFATAVWELLKASGTSWAVPKYDALVTVSMRFLASLASKRMHFELFNNPTLLRQIVEAIVVPNITMREDEEFLFEDNPTEYIQRDMEGSDQDTRRRCACDLVRALCQQFDEAVTAICLEYIGNMVQLYQTNPANWKSKDAAIALMLAVTVRAESAAKGASMLNERVDVMTFFTTHVLPELEDANVNARPIIKADCIKFITTFRQQFPVDILLRLMPLLISHLTANQAVVQTYTAHCVERLLNVKEKSSLSGQWVRRLGRDALRPFLNGLFEGLFGVVDRGVADGQENEYVMKAIMRLLTVVQEDILPVTGIALDKLTASLVRVWRNPSNPLFNHYLFESIAATVRFVCQANPNATADFEERLFPPFEGVLSMDVAEFTPYVFQILAQLLLYRPNGMSPAFARLFPPLLTASLWERKANIPGLVLLMEAYLSKAAPSLVQHIEPILGIFSKLVAFRASEKYAFDLLMSVLEHFPREALAKYERRLFEIVLTRLQTSKSPRTVRLTIHFLGFYAGKLGPEQLVSVLEHVQPGMTQMLIQQVWLPNTSMPANAGGAEAKAVVVGMTRLLAEYRELQQGNPELWGALLAGIVAVAAPESTVGAGRRGVGPEEDEEDVWEKQQAVQEVSGEAVFSKLHFASAGDHDFFPQVPDPLAFLAQQLASLVQSNPAGAFAPVVAKALNPSQLAMLQARGARIH